MSACICDTYTKDCIINPGIITQNSDVDICVKTPQNNDVVVAEIQDMTLYQPDTQLARLIFDQGVPGSLTTIDNPVRKLIRKTDMRHFEQARSAKEAEFATGFIIGTVVTEGIHMTSGGGIANAVMAKVAMGALSVMT